MSDLGRPVHATAVARSCPGGWIAALIQGPSGSGKSDLALRLIGRGWRLVADDYAHVWASGGGAFVTAPQPIRGVIEVRGLGIAPARPRLLARVGLVVDCVAGPVERMPEPEPRSLDGVAVPLIRLDPRHASAGDVVAWATPRF